MYRAGIDLGGTNIKAGIVDEQQHIIAEASVPTNVERPYQDIIRDMAELVKTLLKQKGIGETQLKSIGIGSPGTIDAVHGVVLYSNNFGWENVPLTEQLKKYFSWPVIYDVSNYNAGLKYSTFIASDNPYTEIENKDLSDGSSCIVVKESFGNAFIPFLVDHYQTVYVVDYRYWTGSISKLAQDKNVNDVLFLNNLSMIRNKSLVGKLYRVL